MKTAEPQTASLSEKIAAKRARRIERDGEDGREGRSTPVKPLPHAFNFDGFAFRLIQRAGDVALFEKRKPSHSRESFEVVIVQQHPAEKICGREYPAREAMPPSEAWGTSGWTYTELEDARRKFRALVESRQEATFQPAATPAGAFSCAGSVTPAVEGKTVTRHPQPPRRTQSSIP